MAVLDGGGVCVRLWEMLAEIEVDAATLFVRVGGGVVDAVRVDADND